MQFLNFKLHRQNIDLEWADGGYADLHNDFDFICLKFQPGASRLKRSWRKSAGAWATNVTYDALHLIFGEVSYFRVKERDSGFPFTEDDTLMNICRTPPEVRDDFENIYSNEGAQPDYDLFILFQSEWGLKVNAESVRLELFRGSQVFVPSLLP